MSGSPRARATGFRPWNMIQNPPARAAIANWRSNWSAARPLRQRIKKLTRHPRSWEEEMGTMLRRTLGRGLEALIPGDDQAPRPEAPSALPLDAIAPSPFQPRRRFDAEKLQELTNAIRRHGV